MTSFKATITDPIGLHARPASKTVTVAAKFVSDIIIKTEGKEGNLKSIMNVMALGIKQGASIEIEAKGEDEDEAIKALQAAMKKENII